MRSPTRKSFDVIDVENLTEIAATIGTLLHLA